MKGLKLERLKQFVKAASVAFPVLLVACTGVTFDPGAGGETVMVQTMNHPNDLDVEYLRKPAEGPLTWKGRAWTLLWFVPLDRPDLGLWLRETLPPGADAANVRASVTTPVHGHLLYFLTLGLVRFQNVEFQADPVRIVPPPVPLYSDRPNLPTLGSTRDIETSPTIKPSKSL